MAAALSLCKSLQDLNLACNAIENDGAGTRKPLSMQIALLVLHAAVLMFVLLLPVLTSAPPFLRPTVRSTILTVGVRSVCCSQPAGVA